MIVAVPDADARAVVREFVAAVWNGEDPAALDALTTDDFALHQLVAGETHDRESFRGFQADYLEAIPDFSVTIEDLIVDGDDAVALVEMAGTPEKPLQAVKPTGRSFAVPVFQKYRLHEGRVAEVWVMADAIGTLRQLGIFPPGPGTVLRMVAGNLRSRLFGR